MSRFNVRNWKFRCPRIAEFPFCIGAAVILSSLLTSNLQAQTELPELVKRNVHQIVDSLFTSNGESWSGTVWSSSPDFRRPATDHTNTNGFILEELQIEEMSSLIDPSGRTLSLVQMRLRGNLLMKEGKIIPLEVERALDVLHDQQQPLAERYPDLLRKDSSLWSNVIQPALVAIGAAAIIALFFFVRS
jgi:hypothetical protein